MTNPLWKFAEPRFVVSFSLIALFAWAFGENVADETMKGALIAAFAGAWGYWLGSSRGAAESNERTDKVLDIAKTNADTAANTSANTVNVEAENVSVDKK